uniref:Uncharacterized protein n=1 Tax=Octopus bimaculoides TaxID=37653 RepID=A0A0L8GR77_OCTBM
MLARKLALVLEIRRGKWIQRPIQLCKDIKRMLQKCLKEKLTTCKAQTGSRVTVITTR